MCLKSKLKRIFKTSHKYIICSIVILTVIYCSIFSVSAAKSTNTITLYVARVSIGDMYSGGYNDFEQLQVYNVNSPFGNKLSMFFVNSDQLVSFNGFRGNLYVDQVYLAPNVEYTLKFKLMVPWSLLNTGGDSIQNQIRSWYLNLSDSSRQYIYKTTGIDWSFRSNWVNSSVDNPIGSGSAEFGFIDYEINFTVSEDRYFWFFNWGFTFDNLTNGRGWFGVSDCTLTYEYDPLVSPNYNPVNGSNIEEEGRITAELDNQAAPGLDATGDVINGLSDLFDGSFFSGLLAWSQVISKYLIKFPWLNNTISFSLSIGLYAFLLGISIAIVYSFRRRN